MAPTVEKRTDVERGQPKTERNVIVFSSGDSYKTRRSAMRIERTQQGFFLGSLPMTRGYRSERERTRGPSLKIESSDALEPQAQKYRTAPRDAARRRWRAGRV